LSDIIKRPMSYVNDHEEEGETNTLDCIFKTLRKLVQGSKPKGEKETTTKQGVKFKQVALYPLNSQIIDKSPPHLMLRDMRGLNICVFVHEDIPELV
jgi:hypothetical protein